MPEPLISNISDTARWVAVYRAWESARPDALFNDPFAERLAGERGKAIAAVVPRQARSGWPMVVRTKWIDDLTLASVKEGCDCVVNLAAGLDTRPYRLALPAWLRWVEADLPGMIDEKEKLLAGEKAVCRLSREKVDLSDADARGAFLDRVLEGASKALVITEGLLGYLDEEVVRRLSQDLLSRPAVRWWMIDPASPAIMQMMQKGMGEHLTSSPLKFAPPNGVTFYEDLGWKAQDICDIFRGAIQFRRLPWFLRLLGIFPQPDPRNPGKGRWSAVVRLGRPT